MFNLFQRFAINSNHYPVDKIKFLDGGNASLKNYFITYDTKGLDWTIRLWDLNRGDVLVSSFTCPSRIVSCSLNIAPLYFNHNDDHEQFLLLAVALYACDELLVVKLLTSPQQNQQNTYDDQEDNDDFLLYNDLEVHNEINLK